MPALSKKQQKFMGIVRSIQKGEQPASKFSKDAQDVAKDMKKKDVKKFASTKHKGLPMKKEILGKLKEMIRQELSEYTYGVGDVVKDVNPTCPHYGAKGKVKSVNPRSVVFVVTNKGKNFKPGMKLEKSHDQMKKINEIDYKKDTPRSLKKSNFKQLDILVPKGRVSFVVNKLKKEIRGIKIRHEEVDSYTKDGVMVSNFKKDDINKIMAIADHAGSLFENKVFKVGDTVSLLSFDRRHRGRAKVKGVTKSRANKFGIKNHYITNKGTFTDMEVEGTEAFKLRFKGDTEKKVMKAMNSPYGVVLPEQSVNEKMRPAVKKLLKQKGYGPIFQAIDNSKRQFKQMKYSRGEIQDTLIGMFGNEDPKILQKINESINEATALNDPSVGTKNYKGVGWFWTNDDWKHYLRNVENAGRKEVHDLWLKARFPLKKTKSGQKYFDMKDNYQKRKAYAIVDKLDRSKKYKMESINEMSAKSKKIINKLNKKEKEMFMDMIDIMGFDQVMADYKKDKKAFKQALKDMSEGVIQEKFSVKSSKDYMDNLNTAINLIIRQAQNLKGPLAKHPIKRDINKLKAVKTLLNKGFGPELSAYEREYSVKNSYKAVDMTLLKKRLQDGKFKAAIEYSLLPALDTRSYDSNSFYYMKDSKGDKLRKRLVDVLYDMRRKVMIMVDDSNKLLNKLNGMNKEDSLPSWWSDKITLSQSYLSKATDYLTNPVESIKVDIGSGNVSAVQKGDDRRKKIAKSGGDYDVLDENLRQSDKKILMVIATELVKTQMKGKNKNQIRKELPNILSTMGTNDFSKKPPTNRFNKNKMITLGKGFGKLSDYDKKVFINTLMYNAGL
jgi:hypothetical protein